MDMKKLITSVMVIHRFCSTYPVLLVNVLGICLEYFFEKGFDLFYACHMTISVTSRSRSVTTMA